MYRFDYEKPSSLDAASAAVAAGGQALAGGQTLLASMKQRLMQPEKLIDLSLLKDIQGICMDKDAVVIGAMTRHQAVAANAEVNEHIPALARLAGGIGDKQVRAMGTLGGSISNNDPAACYPSAVLALNATVQTTQRSIAADDFFLGLYATALELGELVKSVSFPIPDASGYAKFKQPASRYAVVGVFVAKFSSGVRVAITGAGNGVFRHAGLEAALTKDFSPQAVESVAIDASELNGDIHASADYRAALITVQTQRAVEQALA
ncbi:MAG: FAD binding domain-containing protein [Burkholderiaceae bacterium]